MAMTPPTRARLVAKLTPTQQDRLDAMDAGDTDPGAEELAAACALVDVHTAGRTVASAALQAWALDLAAFRLAAVLDDPNEQQKDLFDRAMEDLAALRDGKFQGGAPAADPAPGSGAVAAGSKADIFAH